MFLDFPLAYGINFQNPGTPIAEGIIDLHHSIFFYLLIILIPVLYIFYRIIKDSNDLWMFATADHLKTYRKDYLKINNLIHGTVIEIIWTVTPSIILMLIAMPSFALLYSIDEVIDPKMTIKVIGHQWYWSYELNDENFDSYMLPIGDLNLGDLRLLEVDNVLLVPSHMHLRFIVTSLDVLHSFAIPSLGIKVDAVPGRLNQVSAFINREGVYYGQCSELCGVNHGFMPIKVIAIDIKDYN
jgi:cytochrome c oxidase subunit 2